MKRDYRRFPDPFRTEALAYGWPSKKADGIAAPPTSYLGLLGVLLDALTAYTARQIPMRRLIMLARLGDVLVKGEAWWQWNVLCP